MVTDTEALLDSIAALYDAGTDPERWQAALKSLRRLTESKTGVLFLADRNGYFLEILSGNDPAFIGHQNNLIEHNLWYQRRHRAPLNRATLGEQLASSEELRRSLIYTEFLREADTFYLCGLPFYSEGDLFGAVSLLRGEQEEPYGPREVALADAVVSHLCRAARIASLLEGADLYARDLEAAADSFAFGFLLIDGRRRVVFANRLAERLLAAGPLKCGLDRGLKAPPGQSAAALRALLQSVLVRGEGAAARLTDALGGGLKIVGAPLPPRRRDFSCLARTAAATLFLFDETRTRPAPMRMIAQLYSLTPAENRLAEALLGGASLADCAARFRLSRNTLKTELRALFDKTDTMRQSDLIRRLSQLTAAFAESDSDRHA